MLGDSAGSDSQLLLAIEAKTPFTMPLPEDWTLAAAYADEATRPHVKDAVHQAYGYMLHNQLRYALIATCEVYSFLELEGTGLRIADVRGPQNSAPRVTPQMAVYYVIHMAAQDPSQLTVYTRSPSKPAFPRSFFRAVTGSLLAAASWPLQAFRGLVSCGLQQICGKAEQQLGPDFSIKDVWTWDELNLTGWIARGRTGSVFSGRIGGSPVAIKVADYGHRSSVLEEVQQEVEMLDYLRDEQGQAVPRKIAQGYIAESTCYFIAMELLGETLQDAPLEEFPALEESALAALDRVHAAGVLHNDVRPANFLRAGHGRVVLTDFAFAELSGCDSAQQQERAAVRGFSRLRGTAFRTNRLAAPAAMGKLLKS